MDKAQFRNINVRQLGMGLRAIRLQNNMTLADVAEECDSAIAYISKVETGVVVPKVNTLSDILAVYGMTIREFYVWCDKYSHLL